MSTFFSLLLYIEGVSIKERSHRSRCGYSLRTSTKTRRSRDWQSIAFRLHFLRAHNRPILHIYSTTHWSRRRILRQWSPFIARRKCNVYIYVCVRARARCISSPRDFRRSQMTSSEIYFWFAPDPQITYRIGGFSGQSWTVSHIPDHTEPRIIRARTVTLSKPKLSKLQKVKQSKSQRKYWEKEKEIFLGYESNSESNYLYKWS